VVVDILNYYIVIIKSFYKRRHRVLALIAAKAIRLWYASNLIKSSL